ncbi:ribonuclease Z [Ralstonia solanacearum]|uniref:ribonuclease Z n=1 Tax=Ralstonia solanacearum TaxID=305 RepID=UPI00078E94DB|nr:MBL fold metallo-hydrolase [Ralstonia solanacearum]AMP37112.1 ribonuclease Z [Ralstonia solanacearum]AXV85927.1 ribonuclease Z [Ralstonia solanacearum]AXW05434.1 ribonuclease Z [Ralstonia solanacearum]AXW23175.1 ribonuclease Z [Ralstonia solanacearum]AXW80107.1 ribonuclease Z [Ralstonia solanacearum]
MHGLFDARLVNDAFGDPGLYLGFHDERRALLFDLGDLSRLLPGQLLRLSHVFVTHTHMDHFAGFDRLLRVSLGRKDRIVVFGGPGFIAQVGHKLSAYTWNMVERYTEELVIEAREIGLDGRERCVLFSSRHHFTPEAGARLERADDVLHDEMTFRVRGRFVDHDIPCLAFLIEEKARIGVNKEGLTALGMTAGAWLRELKHAVLSGAAADTPLLVQWRDRHGDHASTWLVGELCPLVLDVAPGQRIGYVTDLRYTEQNVQTLVQLMRGVDQLYIESVFLDEDKAHGLRKNHLTARQAGLIARALGAGAVVPFHFSPRYQGHGAALTAEVREAWAGLAG